MSGDTLNSQAVEACCSMLKQCRHSHLSMSDPVEPRDVLRDGKYENQSATWGEVEDLKLL